MLKLLTKKRYAKPVTLREHYNRRNKILLKRSCGGFGDTLMCRMMFEDFHNAFPEAEVTFGCPFHFIDMAKNHPFAKTISLGNTDDATLESAYGVIYDFSTACRVHETKHGPKNTSNRSDIWAAHCGVELQKHNMHLTPEKDMLQKADAILSHFNQEKKPKVLVVTQSQHFVQDRDNFGIGKSINPDQLVGIINGLRTRGYYPYTIHSELRADYERLGVNQFTRLAVQAWIAMVASADYVITVDTAALHIAGGLKKPMVAIFTFTNGKPYTKYYPNVELIQGPCPYGCPGCFITHLHCQKAEQDPYPCQARLDPSDILAAFDRLVARFPLGMSPTAENAQKNRQIDLPVRTA